ncbi:TolB family protein [Roseivirga sp. E12]|uniref:TolB family protein n=1 Tax=Roseivirga sp. E12 TaxID=2819237 RepID=UPI001ABCF768|nr:PD40 domain-containing protein [Roseivirga sp. E12]MBO3698057.1 PD40 domain-containing protein [Roseivirga sp. E12]
MKSQLLIFFLLLISFRVTAQNYNDRFAVVSPDGKSIAFESNRVRPSHIFTVNLDGTNLKQITRKGGYSGPNWSPNSQAINYSEINNGRFFHVFKHDLNESGTIELVADSSLNFASVWRDDVIYYTSNRGKADQLRRVNIRSNEDELIVEKVEHHNGISLNPQGNLAIIIVKNEGNNWDLGLLDIDKKKIVQEFHHAAREDSPSWSPKGDRILFSSNRTGNWDIFSMKWNGSDVTNLTQGKGNNRFASWFPMGERVLFSSDRDGNGFRLYTMNKDGSNQSEIKISEN